MTPGLVSVIVLNWNGKEVIETCVNSLLAQTYRPYEVIVVDNGSQDGSDEKLRIKYGKRIRLIKNEKNLGFAGGCNVGIRASQGEFIALVNSDARLEPDWMKEIIRAVGADSKIGMAASKIYLEGRGKVLDNTGQIISRDGVGEGRGRLQEDRGQFDAMDTLCPSGCAAFYRRKMVEEAGLFDDKFFAYADDIDLGLRGRLLGYTCVFVPRAVAYHQLSVSLGVFSPFKFFLVERNRMWVVLKCFPLRHVFIAPFYTLLRYVYHFLGLFKRVGPASKYAEKISSLSLFGVLVRAYVSTLLHLPYLMAKRMELQKKVRIRTADFEKILQKYGVTVRDVALNEISL